MNANQIEPIPYIKHSHGCPSPEQLSVTPKSLLDCQLLPVQPHLSPSPLQNYTLAVMSDLMCLKHVTCVKVKFLLLELSHMLYPEDEILLTSSKNFKKNGVPGVVY